MCITELQLELQLCAAQYFHNRWNSGPLGFQFLIPEGWLRIARRFNAGITL